MDTKEILRELEEENSRLKKDIMDYQLLLAEKEKQIYALKQLEKTWYVRFFGGLRDSGRKFTAWAKQLVKKILIRLHLRGA